MVFAHCSQPYKCLLFRLLCIYRYTCMFIYSYFLCVDILMFICIWIISVFLCLHVYVLLIFGYKVCIYKSIRYFQKNIHIMNFYMLHYNIINICIIKKNLPWYNFFLDIFIAVLVFQFSYCILIQSFNYLTSIFSFTFSVISLLFLFWC